MDYPGLCHPFGVSINPGSLRTIILSPLRGWHNVKERSSSSGAARPTAANCLPKSKVLQGNNPVFFNCPRHLLLYPMKKEGLFKGLMLAAGFVAVIGILCSQPFFASKQKAGASTEQSDDTRAEVSIQAPADAIPGHAVQVDDSSEFHLITTLLDSAEKPETPSVPAEKVGQFLKVLFRTLIAPNAP
jgi:hypothetical protein